MKGSIKPSLILRLFYALGPWIPNVEAFRAYYILGFTVEQRSREGNREKAIWNPYFLAANATQGVSATKVTRFRVDNTASHAGYYQDITK